jgi:predicted PurR-regulated permease PerM
MSFFLGSAAADRAFALEFLALAVFTAVFLMAGQRVRRWVRRVLREQRRREAERQVKAARERAREVAMVFGCEHDHRAAISPRIIRQIESREGPWFWG